MADESIIAKIRALRAKVSNHASTEAEVEAAAAAITKLMMKYDVQESDLVEKQTGSAVHVRTDLHKNSTDLIINVCWQGIQALTETKMYRERDREGARYNYIGHEPDVEMAMYLHEMIVLFGRRAWYAYRAGLSEEGARKSATAREDFYTAFGYRICQRMMELAEERRNARSNSTALVVVKTQIIKDKMKEMGLVLHRSRSSGHRVRDGKAGSAGASAANSINLNRPFAGAGNRARVK